MTSQQTELLTLIQTGSFSARQLADLTGYAQSSVRRDIQVLRRYGILINDARDNNGLYRISA